MRRHQVTFIAAALALIASAAAAGLGISRGMDEFPARPALGPARNGPLAPGPGSGSLTLEIDACPADANAAPGFQVAVAVWMRDLDQNATGFQAFLEFDDVALAYRGDLSSYTALPFPMHVQSVGTAEVMPGKLRLDGSDEFLGGGTDQDSLLATLVFDMGAECSIGAVDFDLNQLFASELSFEGIPLVTALLDTGDFIYDVTPPNLTPCPDASLPADPGVGDGCQGAFLNFAPPFLPDVPDNCPGDAQIDCVPPNGTFLPVNTPTSITCVAVDDCQNLAVCTFTATVVEKNRFEVIVDLPGSRPATRCIRFITDTCLNATEVPLQFTDHDANPATPVRAFAAFRLDCGNWTTLCAKDRQHTTWSTITVSVSGGRYVGDGPLVLAPGDDDADGAVTMMDVAVLMMQFGGPQPAGGCPWNGMRGADFSNNGNVGSEDYSLLSGNWMATTTCACAAALEGQGAAPAGPISVSALDPALASRADLLPDGVIDFRDVAVFEALHGLSGELSAKIAAAAALITRSK